MSIPGWKPDWRDNFQPPRWAIPLIFALAGGFAAEFVAPLLPTRWVGLAYAACSLAGFIFGFYARKRLE